MTEEDLFLNLLDDKAADTLLKTFNENVKSTNLGLKKLKLKKIFRGISNKKRKSNMNPFDFAIYKCSDQTFKTLDEIELFNLFSKDVEYKIPNYIKLANALYYHPNQTRKCLHKIIYNYENQMPLFKNTTQFTFEKEVKEYLLKDNMCSINIKNSILDYVIQQLDKESELKLKELKEIVNNSSLLDYQNMLGEESIKYSPYLIQLSYLLTHDNETEIENGISLNMLINYYDNKINTKNNNLGKTHLNELNKEIKNISKSLEIAQKENINLRKQNKQLKKHNTELNKELCNSKKETKEKENLKKKIKELENKEEKLTKTNENINSKYELLEKDFCNLVLLNDNLNKKINNLNAYFDYASTTIESEEINYLFAVVNTIEVNICKSFFPEIIFIDANKLNEELYNEEILNINTIYIQRNGISSSKINLIEKFAKQNNIETKLIIPRNEKELIENIVNMKIIRGN